MIMNPFLTYCNQLTRINAEAAEDLTAHLSTRTIDKGEYLLKGGEVCRHLFFIEKGLVKTFFTGYYKDFIMRFFAENSLFTVLDSYVLQKPSIYRILALEKTVVSCISHNVLEQLCKKHHDIETLLRRLVSFASINMMKRISEMLEENGTQRYHHFVNENSGLIQRISLGDLAAYLGITQVSLSRIRAR